MGGMDYWRAACICLLPFLFILLVCFPLSRPLPLLLLTVLLLPSSSTHFHFALIQFLAPVTPPSPPPHPHPPLFSPPFCLPREKRFCLLLVSAPSQSAFLISSYCFCLIFKCYPGPNGNPYAQKEMEGEREWGARGGEGGEREKTRLGIVFHSRTLRQSPPTPTPRTLCLSPPPPHHPPPRVPPSGKDLEGFG